MPHDRYMTLAFLEQQKFSKCNLSFWDLGITVQYIHNWMFHFFSCTCSPWRITSSYHVCIRARWHPWKLVLILSKFMLQCHITSIRLQFLLNDKSSLDTIYFTWIWKWVSDTGTCPIRVCSIFSKIFIQLESLEDHISHSHIQICRRQGYLKEDLN